MAMDRADSTAAMASLASYAEESESEDEAQPLMSAVDTISDDEHDTPTMHMKSTSQTSKPTSMLTEDENSRSDMGSVDRVKAKKRKAKLVSYGADDLEESSSSEEDAEGVTEEQSVQSEGHGKTVVEGKVRHSSLDVEQASSLSRAMVNKSFDEIELPPEPPTKCSKQLQDKIASLYERKIQEGLNLNNNIQNRVDFRNPSIYEKLIEFCGIDEKGTNYPPELYDPSIWGKESFYDALDKAQKQDMEKREKEKKERTKVEFVTATKKPGSKPEVISIDDKKRKSKWDEPGHTAAGRIVESINKSISANLTSHVSGTKSTVIPATGSISKKPSK
ncbi:SAP30-binding protein-like [Mya arenaria]|uniref:SAP30-binding protein-like n=1 Tax=Mya arenaria TaxID=6604 RepID=UPI0022E2E51A|nr:SAP30-binding protein-like [Mya arenaria]XP_052801068.1 SAP30-binding protein-like [Mya arenaria]XP_052801069.1 SAP30-binding protein-like [Mya arenaria]